MNEFDITIVGGGMVGAATALAFAKAGWKVALIEKQIPQLPEELNDQPDIRVSAISAGSIKFLESLDIWQDVLSLRATPYHTLKTWETDFSEVSFTAQSLGLSELGYMVENRILQCVLLQALKNEQTCQIFEESEITRIVNQQSYWHIELASLAKTSDNSSLIPEPIKTKLLIGADGANSQVRRLANIGVTGWNYAQSCMLISAQVELPSYNTTWQQFTQSGPRAYLPLHDNWATFVWYDSPHRLRELSTMQPAQLAEQIKQHFPNLNGDITVHQTGTFPLTRQHVQYYVKPRLALTGDAAHTINPLAGQGVNLGFKDVERLVNILTQARKNGENWQDTSYLMQYEKVRRRDNLLMQSGMDLFYFGFSNSNKALKLGRNIGLFIADRAGILKNQALKYALGL